MNPLPYTKTVHMGQLSTEFDAIYLGKVLTVRGNADPSSGGISTAGEVVHDGTLTDAMVQAVIAAHVPKVSRLEQLRTKRKAGEKLTADERDELMDLLLGL